jgi:hypothetical protein
MKSLLAMAGVTALGVALGLVAALAGDRTTLVPPPDARVEAFLRQLSTRRGELALTYLARGLRQIPASELQDRFAAIERQQGSTWNVTAETLSLDRQSAKVRGELASAHRTKTFLEFGLRWEQGEWVIQELPDSLRR